MCHSVYGYIRRGLISSRGYMFRNVKLFSNAYRIYHRILKKNLQKQAFDFEDYGKILFGIFTSFFIIIGFIIVSILEGPRT